VHGPCGFCLGIVVTAISAAGCAPAPDRARYTVEAYRQDHRCAGKSSSAVPNDPGTLERSADCVNAREAERAVGVGSLRDLPPLRLPAKK